MTFICNHTIRIITHGYTGLWAHSYSNSITLGKMHTHYVANNTYNVHVSTQTSFNFLGTGSSSSSSSSEFSTRTTGGGEGSLTGLGTRSSSSIAKTQHKANVHISSTKFIVLEESGKKYISHLIFVCWGYNTVDLENLATLSF